MPTNLPTHSLSMHPTTTNEVIAFCRATGCPWHTLVAAKNLRAARRRAEELFRRHLDFLKGTNTQQPTAKGETQ